MPQMNGHYAGKPYKTGLLAAFPMVGAAGFEPTTSSFRTKRATRLRYAPTCWFSAGYGIKTTCRNSYCTTNLDRHLLAEVKSLKKNAESDCFGVGECLYRYRSSGTYFAYFWRGGKQIKKTLKTR